MGEGWDFVTGTENSTKVCSLVAESVLGVLKASPRFRHHPLQVKVFRWQVMLKMVA